MKRTYIAFIITVLVVGFAAVATNLIMNGTINFGFNQEQFGDDVIFTYTNTMHGEAKIEESKKEITYHSSKLENVGQEAILDFDVTNKSVNYDADVTIKCGLKHSFETYQQYINMDQSLGEKFNLPAGQTKRGRLTITLKKAYDDVTIQDIQFTCVLEATPKERDSVGTYTPITPEYEEILLKGADPVVSGDLIPVTIDDEGTVTRADTTKEWYRYEDKKWANAVILNDGETTPDIGATIEEDQIEAYFVWIPKYRYKIFDMGTYSGYQMSNKPYKEKSQTIEIEFGTQNTQDNDKECVSQTESGATGTCSVGKWMTHPAFIAFDVNGFWVGKFEVGYKDATDSSTTNKNEEDSSKVIVKPNKYSWRGITIKNMFYNLKGYNEELDSHMMKNTEWGAVAYLSHSIYGTNKFITPNLNTHYLTGYANAVQDENGVYPAEEAFPASTTGNITGIYDMAGGAWEEMAAYTDGQSDSSNIGQSEFTKADLSKIDKKYFDVYNKNSNMSSYLYRILGDATGELGPFISYFYSSWQREYASFLGTSDAWFMRGGSYSTSDDANSQFAFNHVTGGTSVNGFRLVLSPKE